MSLNIDPGYLTDELMRIRRDAAAVVQRVNTLLQLVSPGKSLVLYAYPNECKIDVIKILREIAGVGLKEAKGMTDQLPAVVLSDYRPSVTVYGGLTVSAYVDRLRVLGVDIREEG